MREETIVRENLMTEKGYAPYCMGCSTMNRLSWETKLSQFQCNGCGIVTEFPKDFIDRYKLKWNK